MPRNSSGTYTSPPGDAAVSGATISSVAYNGQNSDFASEVTNSLDRLGRGGMQANLPMGANRITGLANPVGVRSSEASDLVARGHNRFPGLVTSRGAAQDEVARAAHSAGYIGDGTDESAGTSTFQDVIDALDAHPTYSTHDADMLDKWQNWTDAHKNPAGARMTAAEYRARMAAGTPVGPPAEVPTSNARKLHGLKMELDNVIEHDQPGLGVQAGALKSQNRSLTMARGAINDALEAQVPGYARANAISAPLAKRAEAVASGTKLLGPGPKRLGRSIWRPSARR